jgi:hypothetical protein
VAFKSIFDPDFKYRSANSTDVRLTFERIRREQRRAQRKADADVVTETAAQTPARRPDEKPAT